MAALPLLGMAVKLESAPPVTSMSARLKSVLASLSVKVMVSVSPALRLTVGLVRAIAMVGAVVSGGKVLVTMLTVLLASVPSVLALPAASANLALATCTTLVMMLLALGVKVAV